MPLLRDPCRVSWCVIGALQHGVTPTQLPSVNKEVDMINHTQLARLPGERVRRVFSAGLLVTA